MIVKTVIPELNIKKVLDTMKKVFEQYDICKRIPGNPDRDEYVRTVETAVNLLGDREKELITQRYMIDSYRKDIQVYNFHLDPPISKDTYTKTRNRALKKLFITLTESGVLLPEK